MIAIQQNQGLLARQACLGRARGLPIEQQSRGVSGFCRAERPRANPTNLIRVMPAEGPEMHHPQAASRNGAAQSAPEILARLRARAPRIHCITNTVAQNFTANVLLAAGCVPSMTLSPEEVGGFVASADALLVNLGTFDAERREAVRIAIEAARESGIPWVLDPVFIDRSPSRAAFARDLLS